MAVARRLVGLGVVVLREDAHLFADLRGTHGVGVGVCVINTHERPSGLCVVGGRVVAGAAGAAWDGRRRC